MSVIEITAILVFAYSGMIHARKSGFDYVGVLTIALVSAFGGGTLRDVLTQRIPVVLSSELYAIPALAGATVTVVAAALGLGGVPAAVGAAALCFGIRMVGVRFDLHAPRPRAHRGDDGPEGPETAESAGTGL